MTKWTQPELNNIAYNQADKHNTLTHNGPTLPNIKSNVTTGQYRMSE